MRLEDGLPHNIAALHERRIKSGLPLLCQIERNANGIVLQQHGRHVRLREHGQLRFAGRDHTRERRMFADILDRHAVRKPVFRKKPVQHIFRRAALAGRIQRFARKVGQALYRIAVLQYIEHAECIDRDHHGFALRFVIQHGGKIDRHGRNIDFAADKLSRYNVRRIIHADLERILRVFGKLCKAKACRPFQRCNLQDRVVRFFAGKNRRRHQQAERCGKDLFPKLFHVIHLLSVFPKRAGW
ncbi:unknown [Clostridium sp. CAG:1024]|nr:unknown [Clostridium sp. CAG:1024]